MHMSNEQWVHKQKSYNSKETFYPDGKWAVMTKIFMTKKKG